MRTRCFVLPSRPTTWPTRSSCSAMRSLEATISLKVSATLPHRPSQSLGSRTEKSPPRMAPRIPRRSRNSAPSAKPLACWGGVASGYVSSGTKSTTSSSIGPLPERRCNQACRRPTPNHPSPKRPRPRSVPRAGKKRADPSVPAKARHHRRQDARQAFLRKRPLGCTSGKTVGQTWPFFGPRYWSDH